MFVKPIIAVLKLFETFFVIYGNRGSPLTWKLPHREPSHEENECNSGLPLKYDTSPARDNSFYENFISNVSKSDHVFAKVAAFMQLIGIRRRKERREVFKPTIPTNPQPPPTTTLINHPIPQFAQPTSEGPCEVNEGGSL